MKRRLFASRGLYPSGEQCGTSSLYTGLRGSRGNTFSRLQLERNEATRSTASNFFPQAKNAGRGRRGFSSEKEKFPLLFDKQARGKSQFYQPFFETELYVTKQRRRRRNVIIMTLALIAGPVTLMIPSVRDRISSATEGALRFTRSAITAAAVAYDYKTNLKGEGEERKKILKEIHRRSAQRLCKLFEVQGGIYVKAGQHIHSLDYILPPEYCAAMRPLHDRTPFCPFSDIVKVFAQEFYTHPDQLFLEFDREPVAAASLAQVHHARLKDGREVAVKVQFPGLRERCDGDVQTIAFLIDVMAWLFPDFKLKWLVGEFRFNLPKELDFVLEAKNAERTATAFASFQNVHVPKIQWDRTTSRILTMEYIHGVKLDNHAGLTELGVSIAEVAELVSKVFNKQIFIDGFVHCDPHPGNILIRRCHPDKPNDRSAQLVLLDHGLYRELDPEFRVNYAKLWHSIIKMDEAMIENQCRLLAGPQADYRLLAAMLTARSWPTVAKLAAGKMSEADWEEEKARMVKGAAERMFEITDILAAVPSELLLMFKTNDLLRALNRDLGSPINPFEITAKYCMEAIRADNLQKDPSWSNWLKTSSDYYVTMFKVKVFKVLLWFWFGSK